jgi:cellulose synthase/poly-beta-1,6-N-acetylglucosamine synthase-like glycosyltransferase
MMIRRAVLERIGGFDEENFFMYCDDVDFSWRARLSGYRVVYRPTACVFHDKRLDAAAQIEAGEAEVYYSAEAALMMAWKYTRPDLVEEWSAGLMQTQLPQHRKAVEVFNERRQQGRLPQPLDPEGRVAQFVGYNYAPHRFGYDD